jgi:hypothetical protein
MHDYEKGKKVRLSERRESVGRRRERKISHFIFIKNTLYASEFHVCCIFLARARSLTSLSTLAIKILYTSISWHRWAAK